MQHLCRKKWKRLIGCFLTVDTCAAAVNKTSRAIFHSKLSHVINIKYMYIHICTYMCRNSSAIQIECTKSIKTKNSKTSWMSKNYYSIKATYVRVSTVSNFLFIKILRLIKIYQELKINCSFFFRCRLKSFGTYFKLWEK